MFHIVKERCKKKRPYCWCPFYFTFVKTQNPFAIFVSFSFFFQQYNFVQEFRELYKAHLEEQKNMSKVAPQRSLSR